MGDLAASHDSRRRTRARPKTAGMVSSSSRERGSIEKDRPDGQELEVRAEMVLLGRKCSTHDCEISGDRCCEERWHSREMFLSWSINREAFF